MAHATKLCKITAMEDIDLLDDPDTIIVEQFDTPEPSSPHVSDVTIANPAASCSSVIQALMRDSIDKEISGEASRQSREPVESNIPSESAKTAKKSAYMHILIPLFCSM